MGWEPCTNFVAMPTLSGGNFSNVNNMWICQRDRFNDTSVVSDIWFAAHIDGTTPQKNYLVEYILTQQ